jgi:hypothetical protein
MKIRRRSLTSLELALVAILLVAPAAVSATTVTAPATYVADKPYAYIYGTATNTVLSGQSPMNYNPSSGVESTLPYNYGAGKISFPLGNVAFTGNLLNASVKGTNTVTSSYSASSVQALTANGVPYTSAMFTATATVTTFSAMSGATTDILDPVQTIPANANLVVTAEVSSPAAAFTTYTPFVTYGIVDTGGSLHNIEINFATTFASTNTAAATSQTPASSLTMSYATGTSTGVAAGTVYTVQASLAHILTTLGYTWTPSVVKYISYGVSVPTGTSVAIGNSITGSFFNAFVSGSAVKVNAGYAKLFNGTKTANQTYTAAVTSTTAVTPLAITGQAWKQVAGVTFPFVYAPAPKETLYPAQLQIQYDFNMSTFPSAVTGLSWSGADLNMSMNALTPNMLSTLFINGGSYETTVTSWTGTTTGTLLTSMAEGTVYYLQTLVTYTDATYNVVTAAPSLYSNPTAWFEQYFWEIVIAAAGIFGLGAAAYQAKARELRVSK